MIDDDKPTISERYSVSVSNGTSQEHMILAAGMQHERLGALLLRLQSEYDTVRGELEHAGHILPQRIEQARELAQRARLAERLRDYDAAATLKAMAADVRARAPDEVLSARSFILLGLKTLHDAKQRFGAFALGRAAKQRGQTAIGSAAILKLAGRVLDVWLDPICHVCDGTGLMGNRYQGETEHQCSACHGSGHRRDVLGNNQDERRFASDLLAELQRRVAAAAGGIGQMLRPDDATKADADAMRGMQRRLSDLRSDFAQSD